MVNNVQLLVIFHEVIFVNSFLVSGEGLTLMSKMLEPMLVKFPGILMASLKLTVTKPVEVMDLIYTRRSFPAFVLF
jgi:hypothetical protein